MIKYIFILFLMINFPLMAQGLEPLPVPETMDKETFLAGSRAVEKSFDNQPSLNFKINIPKNFIVKRDDQLKTILDDGRQYGEVFYAYGPTIHDLKPYVSIQTFKLDRMISAKNWIISRILKNNYTLRGIESDYKEEKFDTFYVRLDNFGRSEAIRAKGFLHQNQLVLVESSIPIKLFRKEKDNQIHIVNSFEFQNEYDVLYPEDIVEYEFLESFALKYPESWRLMRKAEEGLNDHSVTFKTTDENGFLVASVDVSLISNRSLKDRVDRTIYPVNLPQIILQKRHALGEQGLSVGKIIERNNVQGLKYKTEIAMTEVYPLMRKKSEVFVSNQKNPVVQEFWMTIIKTPESDGKNYILTMTAPSRNVDLYYWSIAKRAYELMIQTVR